MVQSSSISAWRPVNTVPSLNIYPGLIKPVDDRKCFIRWLTSGIFVSSSFGCASPASRWDLFPFNLSIFFHGVLSLVPCAFYCVNSFFSCLCFSMGSEQWQQAWCGSGGQELHPPCRQHGRVALSKPSHGVDARQTEGPSEGGALGPDPQQPGLFCRTGLGYVSRSPPEGLQQLQQGTNFCPRLCVQWRQLLSGH